MTLLVGLMLCLGCELAAQATSAQATQAEPVDVAWGDMACAEVACAASSQPRQSINPTSSVMIRADASPRVRSTKVRSR